MKINNGNAASESPGIRHADSVLSAFCGDCGDAIIRQFGLPALPEADESMDIESADSYAAPRYLTFFGVERTPVVLREYVTLADAKEYCNREDTHGRGWFVGFDRM